MAAFQNWSSLQRLDAMVPHDSNVSLYHGDQLVLTVGKGVTFGFLKLLYNTELSNSSGTLLGVKLRGDSSQRVISLDDAFLDKDEYELIVEDYITSVTKPGNPEPVAPTFNSRHIQNIQYFLNQYQFNATANQRFLPQLPLSLYPLPHLSSYNEPVVSNLQQSPLAFSNATKPVPPHVAFSTEVAQVENIQTEAYTLPGSEPKLHGNERAEEVLGGENESISQMSVDNEVREVGQGKCPKIDGNKGGNHNNSAKTNGALIETGKFPYQCEVCHIPFKSKTKLDYHKRRHTEDNPHKCTYCGEAFKFYQDLSKHRDEQHLCNKSFKCEQCTKSFSSRKELERHLWRHTGKKTHKCELCGKEYTSAGNLSFHQQKHTGVKPLKCSLCPKLFRHKTVLENHIRMSHTGERPFACMHCKKTFPTNSQLSSHEKRHSDSRPYKCIECGKAFRQGHILKRHALVHTNERPYKCHVCPKTFRELSNLQYHKRTHFDKSHRSVVCPLCGKNIIAGRGIKRHLKLHHNRTCANENDARILLASLQPAEKSNQEEVSNKQPETLSVNGSVLTTHTDSMSTTVQLPLNVGISREELPPTTSFDAAQSGNLSTEEGDRVPTVERDIVPTIEKDTVAIVDKDIVSTVERDTVPCRSLRSETRYDNICTRRATGEERSVTELGSNARYNKKEAKFRCSTCLRTFRGPKTLTNHMKIAHGDCRVLILNGLRKGNRLKCKECHLFFANRDSLNVHTDKVHSGFAEVAQEEEQEVAQEATHKETREVTQKATQKVAPKVTQKVMLEVKPEVTQETQNGVTLEVTPELTPEVTQEGKVGSSSTKQTDGKINLFKSKVIRAESNRDAAEIRDKGEEATEEQKSEKGGMGADVLKGDVKGDDLIGVYVLGNEAVIPCSVKEDGPPVSRIDSTQVGTKQKDAKQVDATKQTPPHFSQAQVGNFESILFNTSEPDRTVTGLLAIDLKRSGLIRQKMSQNCNNKEFYGPTALEQSMNATNGQSLEIGYHNEMRANCKVQGVCSRSSQEQSSFQVIYSCISKEQNKVCKFGGEPGGINSPPNALTKKSKAASRTTTENNRPKERKSNLMERLITKTFDGNAIHVLENDKGEQLSQIDESTYKEKGLPVIGHDVLENEPPSGYSFGFLPILIANEYLERI